MEYFLPLMLGMMIICFVPSIGEAAANSKEFTWNQNLYNTIVKNVEMMEKQKESHAIANLEEVQYQALMTPMQEEYFTHPAGAYSETKEEMRKDTAYLTQKLTRNYRRILYSGQAIQAAIDDVAKSGGGKVIIPPGIWHTGALELKSGVELHIEKGAVLQFVRNKSNVYYPLRISRWEGVECINFSPLIYAYGAKNISVTGEGILDGGADVYNWMPWKYGDFHEENQKTQRNRLFALNETGTPLNQRIFDDKVSTLRPPFIQFYKCQNVRIEDVHIKHSPFWEVHPVLCENVLVKGVHIESNLYNNDGVDPESCKQVLIEDCYFQTGDDCIAIKSGRNEDGRRIGVPSENIVIRHNHFSNGHGGITIGSEISGGVHNVFAENNDFDSPDLDYPLRFKTNAQRGGKLSNFYFRNSFVNKSRIALVHCDFYYEDGRRGKYLPDLRNIIVENFQTRVGDNIDAEYPFYLRGFPDAPIQNVLLKDICLQGVKHDSVLENVQNLCYEHVVINGIRLPDGTKNVGALKE